MTASAAVDRTLAALADPHRRRAVELLGLEPRRAGELARAMGLSPPAMSRHLKSLRLCGLVEEDHDGFDARVRIYRLKVGAMDGLKDWLEETERLWANQLLAFKAQVERDEA